MQLLRVGAVGGERPVATVEGKAFDLSPVTDDIDGAFLAGGGIAAVRDAIAAGRLPECDIAGQRIGAPIARPQAVWCIGMNYAAHAAESGAEPPTAPIVFFKTANTIVGPDDGIIIPRDSVNTDWEVELAIVMGRRAQYLPSPDVARDYIAGFTMSNDVSEREWQLERSGGQWGKGKCFETFNPLGPALVPASDLDPGSLRISSWVNGEARQSSSTSDLIFDVDYLVWYLSQVAVLESGDVVNTGTPQGVALSGRFPYLRPGDVVETEIEGIGRARQVCRAADGA